MKKFVSNIQHDPHLSESDHDGVTITITSGTPIPPRAQWYFSNDLLKIPEFINEHEQFLSELLKTTEGWDTQKSKIRKWIIDWFKTYKSNNKITYEALQTKLKLWKKELDRTKTENALEELNIIKQKIETLQTTTAEKIRIYH